MTKLSTFDTTGTLPVTGGWSEGTINGTMNANGYYLIAFYVSVPGSTFKNRDNGTAVPTKPYVSFLKGRNVTRSITFSPGTYDIRLTFFPQ